MKITHVCRVEISFPCSDEDWNQLCQIRKSSQAESSTSKSMVVEQLSLAENVILQDMQTVAQNPEYSTPTLDIMRSAGLGRLNLSAIVRTTVKENPGLCRKEIFNLLKDEYPNRFGLSQVTISLNHQVYIGNIVRTKGQFFME